MIDQSVLEKLEFEKILNHISKYSSTENGKKLILGLYPKTDAAFIKNEGLLIEEAKDIINKTGYPPIEYLSDINNVLAESRIEGSILSSIKVLEILKLAKTSRLIIQFFLLINCLSIELKKLLMNREKLKKMQVLIFPE
jgi:DNA mismatch repair protein MutS2